MRSMFRSMSILLCNFWCDTHSFNLTDFIYVRFEVPLGCNIQRAFGRILRVDLEQKFSKLFRFYSDPSLVLNVECVIGILIISVVIIESISVRVGIVEIILICWMLGRKLKLNCWLSDRDASSHYFSHLIPRSVVVIIHRKSNIITASVNRVAIIVIVIIVVPKPLIISLVFLIFVTVVRWA